MRAAASRWRLTLLLTLLLTLAASPAESADQLVLVVGARSEVTPLGFAAVRQLFLGLTVLRAGQRLHPLLNEADGRIREVFLQNVVSMSDTTYERRILALAVQEGRPPPPVYKDRAQLLRALAEDPAAVSYAWLRDVESDKRIRVLRVLWSD